MELGTRNKWSYCPADFGQQLQVTVAAQLQVALADCREEKETLLAHRALDNKEDRLAVSCKRDRFFGNDGEFGFSSTQLSTANKRLQVVGRIPTQDSNVQARFPRSGELDNGSSVSLPRLIRQNP